MRAKYAGRDAVTGQSYPKGTEITKTDLGWVIAPGAHVPEYRAILMSPLAVEFGGKPGDEPATQQRDINRPFVCSCCRTLPGFSEKDPATYQECIFTRQGDALACPRCGRTGQIQPVKPYVPEKRQCWECGGMFTYADAKRNGGDWSESYCGC